MSSSYHMEQKAFIEASCINDIHTREKLFCSCYFYRLVRRFFSDRVTKFIVYFGLHESSLHFQREEDQVDTGYGKKNQFGAIALSYPPRVRVRATVKLSAAFFHDESSITIGGVRKCNSTCFMETSQFILQFFQCVWGQQLSRAFFLGKSRLGVR